MNQVKNRLQSLGLLDRAFASASDDDLVAAREALDDEHRDAFDELVGADADAPTIRDAIARGRLDGTLESAALVLSDACLADCIEELGEHADHPSTDQLREVLPGLVERHGVAMTQLMLAATVAGDAPASAIIRDLLKHDELVKLPPAEPKPLSPVRAPKVDDAERAAIKAKRKEMRKKKQEEARVRREQSAKARNRG